MSGVVYDYENVERFVSGTVGQPGERVFFLQARDGSRVTSVVVEKSQVAALATRTKIMLREIKKSDPSIRWRLSETDNFPLEQPIFEEFRVGVISIAWDVSAQRIVYELREASSSDSDNDEEILFTSEDLSSDVLRVHLTPSQAQSFVKRSESLISAGRLPCPFCAIPIDPQGHLCPRANGYRR
ncbi:unannotated protein [freshwater metagenome]|uniref:Unannotated protein n=1 Tax=freshwater metagenome TaxID=449393 RepID=A0A6J7XR00_9ZZZZ|nr:DUF3090 family protein [Actinomycetota bacterium]